MAAVAEAGCKPAPRLDGRHARRGLAWTRAHRFGEGDASRYATLLRVPTGWASFEGEHWLVVKNGSWPAANGAASLVVFRGCDARLRNRGGEDCVRHGDVVARGAWQLHNYALLAEKVIWGCLLYTSPSPRD